MRDGEGKGVADFFYHEFLPAERDSESDPPNPAPGATKPPEEIKSQLFDSGTTHGTGFRSQPHA